MTAERRVQVIVGLTISLGLPFAHLGNLGRSYSGLGPRFGSEVLWWILFAGLLAYVLFLEHRQLRSIGFKWPGGWDIALGFLAGLVTFMGVGVIVEFVLPALHIESTHEMNALLTAPMWFRLLAVTRGALVEETAFRGYGFERIAELTKSPVLAGLVTWALFSIAHLQSWGWSQVIIAAFAGLILTALYAWRGNLWTNVIAHWSNDAAGFVLVPLLIAHH